MAFLSREGYLVKMGGTVKVPRRAALRLLSTQHGAAYVCGWVVSHRLTRGCFRSCSARFRDALSHGGGGTLAFEMAS